MYVTDLYLHDFRGVARTEIDLLHPDRPDADVLELPNVNLLLGQNGGGKSTLLKGIVAAALGPIEGARLLPREARAGWPRRGSDGQCQARVGLLYHPVDASRGDRPSRRVLEARTSGERGQHSVSIGRTDAELGHEVASAEDPDFRTRGPAAYFLAAYGPSRRVDESGHAARRAEALSDRVARVKSLLEPSTPLVPLEAWLPSLGRSARRTHDHIVKLIDRLLPPGARFEGELEGDAYLFAQRGLAVPRGALSDGLQSYLAWVGDLLARLHDASGAASIAEVPGVVLVDEVDQRIHPRWQQTLLARLSATLPRLQFVLTAHSPILAGGLRPENLILLEEDPDAPGIGATRADRLREDVFGGTADQVLTSSYFDLESSRAESFRAGLRTLALRAREGDGEAALDFIRRLAQAGRADSDASDRPPPRRPFRERGRGGGGESAS